MKITLSQLTRVENGERRSASKQIGLFICWDSTDSRDGINDCSYCTVRIVRSLIYHYLISNIFIHYKKNRW